jgi:hypothetical protein
MYVTCNVFGILLFEVDPRLQKSAEKLNFFFLRINCYNDNKSAGLGWGEVRRQGILKSRLIITFVGFID